MTIPNNDDMQRKPTHPTAMLREDFLPDYDLSAVRLIVGQRPSQSKMK